MSNVVRTRGATIAFDARGHGAGVLLIQGVGLIGRGWQPQVDAFAATCRVVTFDNRGIGDSTLDGGAVTVETMAADALAVADAAGLDRFHLVGHSLGGLIAQEVALIDPARVDSLALLCTFARGRDGVAMTPTMLRLGLRTRLGTRAMRRRAFLELVMPEARLDAAEAARVAADLAPLFGHDLAVQPPIAMAQLRAMSRYDARDRLTTIGGIRTLVVSAEHDYIAREPTGRALAAAIPGARFVRLDRAGHGAPIRHADRVNALLQRHFEGA